MNVTFINNPDDFYCTKNNGVCGRNIRHPAGSDDAGSYGRCVVTGAMSEEGSLPPLCLFRQRVRIPKRGIGCAHSRSSNVAAGTLPVIAAVSSLISPFWVGQLWQRRQKLLARNGDRSNSYMQITDECEFDIEYAIATENNYVNVDRIRGMNRQGERGENEID